MDEAAGGAAGRDFLLSGMFGNADLVVQVVVVLLAACSVASWAVIFSRLMRLRAMRRDAAALEGFVRSGVRPVDAGSLATAVLEALDQEAAEADPLRDLRARLDAAMRSAALATLRRQEGGLPFLATLAATAPFVGLFGTVWGIMHSFGSIAAARDTSLDVVAPGIAQALFATAVGLGAAIPAVVGYNLIRAALSRCRERTALVSADIARLAARPASGSRA